MYEIVSQITSFCFTKLENTMKPLKRRITAKVSFRENSVRRKFHTEKIQYGEISVRRKFLTAETPYGENSVQRKIHTAKNSYSEKSYSENSYGENSYGETAGHASFLGNKSVGLYRSMKFLI